MFGLTPSGPKRQRKGNGMPAPMRKNFEFTLQTDKRSETWIETVEGADGYEIRKEAKLVLADAALRAAKNGEAVLSYTVTFTTREEALER